MTNKNDRLPIDHRDGDRGYNHKMRLFAVGTSMRTAVLKKLVAEAAGCAEQPAPWIEALFEKDRTKIQRRSRDMRSGHQEIVKGVMSSILGRKIASNVFEMTIGEFKKEIADDADFTAFRSLAAPSMPEGVYKLYRFSSGIQGHISVSVMSLKQSANLRKATIFMRASSEDPVSESHGIWTPNPGGNFVHTSHRSLTNPGNARTRTLLIGHDEVSMKSGFWFGTLMTSSVKDFESWASPVVAEKTDLRWHDDARIMQELVRMDSEEFAKCHKRGQGIIQFLLNRCRTSEGVIRASSRDGREALGF